MDIDKAIDALESFVRTTGDRPEWLSVSRRLSEIKQDTFRLIEENRLRLDRLEDISQMIRSVADGPFPDGRGGFRERPGPGNILGAEETVLLNRAKAAERASMLVLERIIDELPDVREKFVAHFGPSVLREKLLDHLDPGGSERTEWERLGYLASHHTKEVVAEIFRRAYARDLERAKAAVRLGAFEPAEWCEAQAEKVLATPTVVARSILDRVGKIVARAQHVRVAMTEPLKKP